MTMTREQEILQNEEEFLNAKQALDLDVLDRIYANDVVVTGVLGEPTCSKAAIIDEAKRGLAERRQALASGQKYDVSAENEDMKSRDARRHSYSHLSVRRKNQRL